MSGILRPLGRGMSMQRPVWSLAGGVLDLLTSGVGQIRFGNSGHDLMASTALWISREAMRSVRIATRNRRPIWLDINRAYSATGRWP